MASSQGSKSASNVREQESDGTREEGIGEKRVSSKADVSAYVCNPVVSGSGSNVPIQPRNDLWPERESVFQVTNSGYDSLTDSREAYVGAIFILDIDVEPVS
jgi:hypothetical protein